MIFSIAFIERFLFFIAKEVVKAIIKVIIEEIEFEI